MAEVSGGDGDPLLQAFDRGLDNAHGCFSMEMLPQHSLGQWAVVEELAQRLKRIEDTSDQ